MLRIDGIACRISVEGGEIQILRIVKEDGEIAYTIYYKRAAYPDPDLQIGQELNDGLTLFTSPARATQEAMRVVRRYDNPMSIELPVEGRAALVAGGCSRCHVVGRVLFERGTFSHKDADRVLNYKPIKAFCEQCQQEVDFVPIERGVSPYLDQRESEDRTL